MRKIPVVKIIIIALFVLILLTAALTAVWRQAAYAVWKNLTVPVYPSRDDHIWTGGAVYEKLYYAEDSESQYLDLYVPEINNNFNKKPDLFVLIHGGGFIAGDSQTRQARFMYDYFRDRNYACASINYRLAQEAAFPAGLSDCKAAVRFLRAHADEYGYNADQIAIWGESAGGYLAVMCAVTNDDEFTDVKFIGQDENIISARVNVLVDYYGHIDGTGTDQDWKTLKIPEIVIDIANSWASGDVLRGYENPESFWLRKNISDMTPEELNYFDPYNYINQNDLSGLSVWIVHGDCDITVPYLHSERLSKILSEKISPDAVKYHLIPGMGHASDPLYSERLLSELKSFLDEALA